MARLTGAGSDRWDALAELHFLLAVLTRVPAMEPLLAPPARWGAAPRPAPGRPDGSRPAPAAPGTGNREALVERVRALLRKAESTEFAHEAEAFAAKAQELMTRHAIDEALLADRQETIEVVGVRLAVDNPYTLEKATLLSVVGDANRCRVIMHQRLGLCTVVGAPVDLEQVELLFTSLLVQATRAMAEAGSRRSGSYDRSSTFRRSFLAAYASRIGERLRQADEQATAAWGAGEDAGDGSTAGEAASAEVSAGELVRVLDRQAEAVDDEFERLFPRSERRQRGASFDYRGWAAGREAADAARFAKGRLAG